MEKKEGKDRNYTQSHRKPGQVKLSGLLVTLLVSNFDNMKVTLFKQMFEVKEGHFSICLTPLEVRLDHSLSMT